MNIFQSQLVMADGRTLREHAAEELPFDCQYVKSLGPQLAPKKVSVEEFLREMQGGWGMSWRNGYGERMGDDEEYNPRRDDPNYREHPKQQKELPQGERKAFEKWAKTEEGYSVEFRNRPYYGKVYEAIPTYYAWLGWKARASATVPQRTKRDSKACKSRREAVQRKDS